MTLLIDNRPFATAATASRRQTHAVPEGGVLHFPGVGANVPPPAQLGPMMTPPGRAALFGR